MYHNISQLLALAKDEGKPLHTIITENECVLGDCDTKAVRTKMHNVLSVMRESATRALNDPQVMTPALIAGQSVTQQVYATTDTLCGTNINRMMAMAFSSSEVNASMGRICAAPTAGACGILPAVLLTVAQQLSADDEALIDALLVASGFGAIITKNATVSGAEGGCQAECGTAAAMASAAAVYLKGGTPTQCAHAVAISLINCMGLVCDPVAGLVQMPCSFRNASQSVNALISADMALAGQASVIPPDEVIEAMYRVGKSLPDALRETADGGIAATATGRAIARDLLG